MKMAVIGAGSWGTTVAALAARRQPVTLWARRPELAEAINGGENPDYLGGFRLPYGLRASTDLGQTVEDVGAVIMAVPSHGYRAVVGQLAEYLDDEVPLLSLTKGIEQGSLKRMSEVTIEELPSHDATRVGVMTGPNLAKEIMQGQPAATVIAMKDEATAARLQEAFMDPTFRVYTNTDLVGCETAGALKNVMAIAAGMARGLGLGDNTLAALITRAIAELTRLGVSMGGDPMTFAGLAGVGDLIATCMSSQSRNHRVGVELAKGRKLDQIIEDMNMVAEGVKTTRAVLDLAERAGVETPIAQQVGSVLYESAHPREAVLALMTREAKREA
jgi:glycerol-3-phosphate dehydrogenase (NAD(P)+)